MNMKSQSVNNQHKANNEIWLSRLGQIRKHANSYGQNADDVMQEAYLIFQARNRYLFPSVGYLKCIMKEAARNLKIEQTILSIEQLQESGEELACPENESLKQKQRILDAVRDFPWHVQYAVNLVLLGMNLGSAAKAAYLSRRQFAEILLRAGASSK